MAPRGPGRDCGDEGCSAGFHGGGRRMDQVRVLGSRPTERLAAQDPVFPEGTLLRSQTAEGSEIDGPVIGVACPDDVYGPIGDLSRFGLVGDPVLVPSCPLHRRGLQ